jgi:asparagine synthase (glutamine-hydrolysing)
MLAAQRIYGSEDASQWSDGGIALGRRLMPLLPEDRFDRQPVIGGGGRYVLVADIRLDNREELQSILDIRPEQARTSPDSAILMAAIERWGESCLDRIFGDYAFVLWDTESRQLKLVRDPMGQRPLHYHVGKNFLAFATMPKGLHALQEVPYAPDEERIAQSLALLPETGSRSFFEGIARVEFGQVVTIRAQGLSTRRYWQPTKSVVRYKNTNDYVERLRELLDEAVRARLRSDGQIATYLSGGFDSGAITATAARLLNKQRRRLLAFTCTPRPGFKGGDLPGVFTNEGALAAATAALYPNIEHIVVPNVGRSPVADLDRNFHLNERPISGTAGAGWAHSIDSALARRNVKCILSGGFGNITLSYDGMELLPELFSSGRWIRLFRESQGLVREGRMHWRAAIRETLAPWFPADVWLWIHKITGRETVKLADYSAINLDRFARLDPLATKGHDFTYRPWKSAFEQRLWSLHRVDPGNFRKGGLAGWGFDVRDPTADVRLIEFCLSVPTEQYLRSGVTRSLARRALVDRLPKAVLDEKRVGLFAGDWYEDLDPARTEVAEEISRIAGCETAATAIDIARLQSLTGNWPEEGWERDDITSSYRYVLQRGLAIGHFTRRAARSNA